MVCDWHVAVDVLLDFACGLVSFRSRPLLFLDLNLPVSPHLSPPCSLHISPSACPPWATHLHPAFFLQMAPFAFRLSVFGRAWVTGCSETNGVINQLEQQPVKKTIVPGLQGFAVPGLFAERVGAF